MLRSAAATGETPMRARLDVRSRKQSSSDSQSDGKVILHENSTETINIESEPPSRLMERPKITELEQAYGANYKDAAKTPLQTEVTDR